MIPFDYITEWRVEAPWIDDAQVEQDLVISRALVEIFRHPALADSLALRGGTALSKLQLRPPARYSEDIDLVQTTAQPAGPMMNALRAVLEPWLGKPKWKQGEGRITFYFRYTAEGASPVPMRLKVETNTREHFALYGLRKAPFKVASRWFEGACDIQTYELDELLGTKLRALYQRKQARDLFDLEIALTRLPVQPTANRRGVPRIHAPRRPPDHPRAGRTEPRIEDARRRVPGRPQSTSRDRRSVGSSRR